MYDSHCFSPGSLEDELSTDKKRVLENEYSMLGLTKSVLAILICFSKVPERFDHFSKLERKVFLSERGEDLRSLSKVSHAATQPALSVPTPRRGRCTVTIASVTPVESSSLRVFHETRQ